MSDENFSVGRVVVMSALQGAVFGLVAGLISQQLWIGVLAGVFFGLIMGITMRRVYGSTALSGLDRAQRKQILRALRRGEPVDDPQLAEPAIRHARVVAEMPLKPTFARIAAGVMLVLGLATAGFGVASRGWAGLWSGGMLAVMALVLLFVLVPLGIRQRQRAEQSARATEEKWNQSVRA
ncbi:MAG: hypothetical protein ABW215_09225 [Kibdelosporangium sp.]